MPKAIASTLLVSLLLCAATTPALAQQPSTEQQIEAALQAAPPALRDSARVLGYRGKQLTPLREGAGPLVCLADDPSDDRFHVACYHEALEPFMALGRKLRAQGLDRSAVDSTRRAEIEAGALSMPERPTALYSLSAPAENYDPGTNTVREGRRLHVVYIPYATAASTGLPQNGGLGEPWIMEGGTPWAHIMITPPPDAEDEPESEEGNQ